LKEAEVLVQGGAFGGGGCWGVDVMLSKYGFRFGALVLSERQRVLF